MIKTLSFRFTLLQAKEYSKFDHNTGQQWKAHMPTVQGAS